MATEYDAALQPDVSWQDHTSSEGAKRWKEAALRAAETMDARWAEYERWARTPRGRLTRLRRWPRRAWYRWRELIAEWIMPA